LLGLGRANRPQDTRHAFVADLEALRPHGLRDGPERLSLSAQSDHFADRLSLGLMWDELSGDIAITSMSRILDTIAIANRAVSAS
jgi:hypothetical protein